MGREKYSGQKTEDRRQKTEILLWERLSAAIRTISTVYRLPLATGLIADFTRQEQRGHP